MTRTQTHNVAFIAVEELQVLVCVALPVLLGVILAEVALHCQGCQLEGGAGAWVQQDTPFLNILP